MSAEGILFEQGEPDEENPFHGIINYLNDECGDNIHDAGVVEITCSSSLCNDPQWVSYRDWNGYWQSGAGEGSWICFDFKEKSIAPTNYSLRSISEYYPLHWEVKASTDGSSWVTLDSRDNDELEEGTIGIYPCDGKGEFFRFFKIAATGKSNLDEDYLSLSEVEFFGSLRR